MSRRVLLTSLGAGGVTAVGGCWATEDDAPEKSAQEAAILDLSFTIESQYRPFELVTPQFRAVSDSAVGRTADVFRSGHSPQAPFGAVEMEVTDAGDSVVVAGLATQTDEHVLAVYDRSRGRVGIEVRRAGRTRLLRRRKIDLPAGFHLAFVLCENQVTVLADTGDGWKALLTERGRVAKAVDLRDPEILASHTYAWGARGDSGSATLGAVHAGPFGMAGIRDPHLVQHGDGSPYVREGKVYLTATCAGLGFFQQTHWGVFTLDLVNPDRLEQVGQLFSLRDGLLLGDHAGQIVRDDDNDRWIVATSSWGDFSFDGVHVRHVVTTDDVLHGVHVLETERTELPTSVSSWDPGMTKIDGRWHVGFVESPSQDPFDFHPALAAAAPGADWDEDLRLVGAATDLHQCEGPIITQVEGEWWFLASDGDKRHYPVFTMQMRRSGRLDAPYPTNIPHAQLLPLEDGSHLMITFDGTQFSKRVLGYGGHGDVIILRSRSE